MRPGTLYSVRGLAGGKRSSVPAPGSNSTPCVAWKVAFPGATSSADSAAQPANASRPSDASEAGRRTVASERQSPNAEAPMLRNPSGSVTAVRLTQPWNARSPRRSSDDGSRSDVSRRQLSSSPRGSSRSPDGSVSDASGVSANAFSPSSVRLSGQVREVSPVRANASCPMTRSPCGSVTAVRATAPVNAPDAMRSVPAGTSKARSRRETG